jgi:hypothetical protein
MSESAERQIGSKICMRIGVDLGGAKIEIIALDNDGSGVRGAAWLWPIKT